MNNTSVFCLIEQYSGRINEKTMMTILDISIDQEGATPKDMCIYQFVAVPVCLMVWIKMPTAMEWCEILYGKLFRNNRS